MADLGRISAQSLVLRRHFLGQGLAGLATLMLGPGIGCSSEDSPEGGGGKGGSDGEGGSGGLGSGLTSKLSDIGALADQPDENSLRLPAGFTSRVVARSGEAPVAGGGYTWHTFPDGGATYPTDDGGWIYVSNSEFVPGGAGALRFDADGNVVDAYAILQNTIINCAGGATPYGTWLSCEETPSGRVFECDPSGENAAVERPALGVFQHEAVAYDPVRHHLYLTEDAGDGRLYRFVPETLNAAGFADLAAGRLEVAQVLDDGGVIWHELSDPTGATPTRQQVAESTAFRGGEGIAYFDNVIYFSTKGDNRVWAYNLESETISVLYDAATAQNPILTGVDNVTVTCCGDVLVAEDGGDMQIVAILGDGTLKPLMQVVGHDGSEVTGPAFDPSGTRLYFSSQRGGTRGITYEISGPFHVRS